MFSLNMCKIVKLQITKLSKLLISYEYFLHLSQANIQDYPWHILDADWQSQDGDKTVVSCEEGAMFLLSIGLQMADWQVP